MTPSAFPTSRAARRRQERLVAKARRQLEARARQPITRAEAAHMVLAAHALRSPFVRWPKLWRAWVAKCRRSWATWRALRADERAADEAAFLRGVREQEGR